MPFSVQAAPSGTPHLHNSHFTSSHWLANSLATQQASLTSYRPPVIEQAVHFKAQDTTSQTTPNRLNNSAFNRWMEKYGPYALLGLGGLGVLFPKQSLGLVTWLPRAVWNLPQTLGKLKAGILGLHPKSILPYRSVALDNPVSIFSPIDMRYKNLSFQDWASRFSILGVYVSQGIIAIQHHRRPMETWLRNFGAWYLTAQIMMYTKDPASLYSWVMNQTMVPKKPASSFLSQKYSFWERLKNPRIFLDKALNPYRPKWNYLDWCRRAGINLKSIGVNGKLSEEVYKSAIWNTLDVNELRLLDFFKQQLYRRGMAHKQPRLLNQVKALESFIANITKMRMASVGVQSVGTILLVGIFVPWAAIKIAAPFDKRFERPQRRFDLDLNKKPGGVS